VFRAPVQKSSSRAVNEPLVFVYNLGSFP